MTPRSDRKHSEKTPDQILNQGFVGDVIFYIVSTIFLSYVWISLWLSNP